MNYSNEWKKIKLESLIDEVKDLTSDFETYPLYSFTIESGVTPKTDRYERGFLVKKDGDLFKIVYPGNFVMNPMNLRFGAINYSKQGVPVSVSGYYDIFNIDDSKYNDFWNAYLKTKKTLNTYNAIATGSLVEKKRVHFSQLKDLKMYVPGCTEKEKINKFLQLLDERINTQNKIIEDMDSLKQSISIQLYDQLELNKKLCDVCEVTKGKQINGSELLEEGQYYMMNGGLEPSGYLNQYNTLENTISISEGGNSCGYVRYNKEKFWSGGHCYTLNNLNNDINSKFLYFFLKAKEKDVMALRIGTGLPNIQKKDIESFLIPVPSLETQNDIIKILDSISSKIDVLKKQLEYYKQQKQYLLNNLFI